MVSSSHIATWKPNELEIVSCLSGHLVIKLQLEERTRSWTAVGSDSAQDTKKEKTLHLVVQRSTEIKEGGDWSAESTALNPFKMIHIEVESFDAKDQSEANAEFNRLADELTVEFFGAKVISQKNTKLNSASPSLTVPEVKKSIFKKLFFAIGPWLGGAMLMIIVSLLITLLQTNRSNQKVANTPGVESAASGVAPESWNSLTQDQKNTLLGITAKAAQQVITDENSAAGVQTNGLSQSELLKALGAAGMTGLEGVAPEKPFNAKLNKDQMKKLKSAYSLKVGTGKKVFYVFEDPMCSTCRNFTKAAKELDSSYGLVVIPIGFQEGGREKAAATLCAKDPKAAWSLGMTGLFGSEKACEAGYKTIDANNTMFIDFKLSATPTLVAADGALVVGSGKAADISAWVDQHAD